MFDFTSLVNFIKNTEKPVIEILGPTASGKTDFTVNIVKKLTELFQNPHNSPCQGEFSLDRFNKCEVIVVDSRQVYKGCDISSAKISTEEMDGIIHHGIDLCNSDYIMTVVEFKKYGEQKIQEIFDRGNLPILSGGTMLWLDAISENYIFDKNPAIKSKKRGEKIYDFYKIGIKWDREILYKRINKRAEIQFNSGLIEETKSILKQDLSQSFLTSFGYIEIGDYLTGKISYERSLELNQQRNRKYAKRQLTWWRGRDDVHWVDGGEL